MSRLPWFVAGGAAAAYLFARERKALADRADPRVAAPTPARVQPPGASAPVTPVIPKQSISVPSAPQGETKPNLPTCTERLESLPGVWQWPVPLWNDGRVVGRAPVISNGFGPSHLGIDIMFKRLPHDAFKPGSPNGSKLFVMPDNHKAVAAANGVVWSAMKTSKGYAVVIDHGPMPFATFYTHLEKLFVPLAEPQSKARTQVRGGQPIGIIGYSPEDPAKLKHLHFAVWRGGPKDAFDPALAMECWQRSGFVHLDVLRNGGLIYRPVGARGEPYPQWVRDLDGESGVYLIRQDGELVYVGASVGRLYDTMTRHFQVWRRWKGFWKGQYGEGHDPGLTYDRDSVEVAVRITRASEALDEEARLIQRLRPRDNLIGQSVEEVPF
jgi:murein DD-endopeptidase MepM/ murein hydrolase activator NlpD